MGQRRIGRPVFHRLPRNSDKKWKALKVESATDDAVIGLGDDGRFELRRKGTTVTSVEGLDPAIH